MRPIRGIAVTPIIHLDGSIAKEGYDPTTHYLVASNLELPPIPEAPTHEDARAALAELVEPFAQFPYESEDERYSPVALTLTLLLRPAIGSGNVPAFLQDAPQKNCGKSLATKAACVIATGRIPAANTWPKQEDEQEKMIGAAADAGADVVFFDNVAQGAIVGGAPLDKVVTCDGHNSFRVLGRSELKPLPWGGTVCFTANRARIGDDSDRRIVHSQLIRRAEEVVYQHEHLLAYVLAERPRLLAAAFTLVRGWILAESPRAEIRRLDSFEAWGWTVPSMIRWAGGGDVRELVRDIAGTERDELEGSLLEELHRYLQRSGRSDVTVADLVTEVYRPGRDGDLDALRDAMESVGGFAKGETHKLDVRRFGNRLAAMQNLLQGGYRLRLAGKTTGRSRWTVERVGSRGVRGVNPNSSRARAGAESEEVRLDPPDPPDPPDGQGSFADYLDAEGIGADE